MTDLQSNASRIVEALEFLENRQENVDDITELQDLRIGLQVDADIKEKSKQTEIAEELTENGYLELEGDIEENPKILQVKVGKFREDYDVIPDFNKQGLEDSNQLEISRYFAEWITREAHKVKTVKLDPSRNSKEIWHYNPSSKVWRRGGEDIVNEELYEQIPEEHSRNLTREVISKVHAIDPIHLEDTGTDKGKIPVDNGILDLDNQELTDIERGDYLSSKMPVEYNGGIGTPDKFMEFLEEVTRSQEDMKKLQEFVGYCFMTNNAKFGKALMILGPTDSGKSVFLDVVRELLGAENIAQESLQNLTNNRQWGLANLVGKIANIDHDLDPEAIEDIGTVKKITEGKPISVERKHEQPFDLEPTAKHMYSANKTPEREKEDDAFYNRWLTVVFPRTIPRSEQNEDLIDELTEKEELQKILNWAIAGYHRLEKQGQFTDEKGPIGTKETWREWGVSTERFISNFLVTRKQKVHQYKNQEDKEVEKAQEMEMWISSEKAYELYQKYAVGLDMEVKSKKALKSQIKRLPGVREKRKRTENGQKRGFKHVALKQKAHEEIEDEIEEFEDLKR
jgi:putative DNA primase/helicase